MIASVVGLYTSPIFIHLKPKKDDTSMTTVSWQITEAAFTRWKSTLNTPKEGVKYVQS